MIHHQGAKDTLKHEKSVLSMVIVKGFFGEVEVSAKDSRPEMIWGYKYTKEHSR